MEIQTKRIYEKRSDEDGFRVLADRIWPRGMKKDDAGLDLWVKDMAPSDALRHEFHELGPDSFPEFHDHYLAELKDRHDELEDLLQKARESGAGSMTLLYAWKDEEHNNAVVLAEALRELDG